MTSILDSEPFDGPVWLASVPVVCLVVLLSTSVYLFGDNSSYGPNQIALLFAAGIAQVIGIRVGWKALQDAMVESIGIAMTACLILLMVGMLIGVWMLCGTAPTLMYYGLGLLDPGLFYPASCLICALVAMTIGSSWSTAGTLGIALIGIASVLGLSLEITAGAIISGAYFGDKLSPLSDTTNLASGVAGIDLFDHIRYMLWTTLPAMALALLLYTLLALNTDIGQTQDSDVLATRAALAQHYRIGLIPLLPLLLILVMAARGIPAYPTLAAGSIAGVLIALTYQRDAVLLFGDPTQTLSVTEGLVRAVWQAMGNGFSLTSGNQALDTLLSRGGMSSMLNTVWLIISAMVFGSAMERTGMLRRLVEAILKGVRSIGSLVTATVMTCVGINILSGDQYMSIVLPGRMFRLEYRRQGLDSANLSRTLEDAGTMTSALIPWNTCGAFMAATLGVPTSGYAMFAFLNLMTPLFAIGYALMDFRIQRLQPAS